MRASGWKTLVVNIVDPFAKEQLALSKAVTIAARCNAQLTLINTFMLPQPTPDTVLGLNKRNVKAAIKQRRMRLESLAAPIRKQGINVHTTVEWDFPIQDAIVRYVLKHKPDLLICESHRHSRIARWFLNNTDWDLIRDCPCTLWFVRSATLPRSPSVLVAIDPRHTHDKPANLDDRLVHTAKTMTTQLGGKIRLAHAYEVPRLVFSGAFSESLPEPISASQSKEFVSATRRAATALTKKHGLAPGVLQVLEGEPSQVLAKVAAQHHAAVLVMGAVSRHLPQRPFIGNTAEKLIDHTDCDVLVVKPASFKSSVSKKRPSVALLGD